MSRTQQTVIVAGVSTASGTVNFRHAPHEATRTLKIATRKDR